MAELNTPLTVGDFEIKNRLVMAPLTRARSGESRVPNDLMVEYYQQRANAGLILTEATVIGSKTVGYADTPGLWSQEQAQAWNKIIEAVHAQGSKIVAQLWHVGRISHPELSPAPPMDRPHWPPSSTLHGGKKVCDPTVGVSREGRSVVSPLFGRAAQCTGHTSTRTSIFMG